jgi:hypothetical protein
LALPAFSSGTDVKRFFEKVISQINPAFGATARYLERRPDGQLFSLLSMRLSTILVELTWIADKDKVEYLKPLVNAAKRCGIPIVTLNYDNSVELSADSLNINYDDGIGRWSDTGSFHRSPNAISESVDLIKIHGSIDWRLTGCASSGMHLTREAASNMEKPRNDTMSRRGWPMKPPASTIIFGGKNKLTASGPFLDLLFWFRQELRLSNELIVIGYSFRDDHVNQSILSWLRTSPTNRIVCVTRGQGLCNNQFVRDNFADLGDRFTLDSDGAIAGIQKYFLPLCAQT